MEEWQALLIGIAVSSALFALGVVLFPRLKREKQGYPYEAQIEAVLLPLIFQGICAAYRVSEWAVDEGMSRIRGVDKKEIADSIYAMLPDQIGDYDLSVIKRVVSEERFEALVQNAFDAFDRFFVEHQGHFEELFEEWTRLMEQPT